MTDADLAEYEHDEANLLRHFRVMTIWQAWRAAFRMGLGYYALRVVQRALAPHISPATERAFENAEFMMANDFETANEGMRQAAELQEKRFAEWLGIEK